MTSHEIDYEIFGSDLQMVEIELDPGETVIAEAGAMCYLESGIEFEAKMGDGTDAGGFFGKLASAGKRMLAGESLFLTHFTNHGNGKKTSLFCCTLSRQNYPDRPYKFQRVYPVPVRRFFMCGYGYKNIDCFHSKIGCRFLRWSRVYSPKVSRRRKNFRTQWWHDY